MADDPFDELMALVDLNDIVDLDTDRYILDEQGNPERCPSLLRWAKAMDDPRRQVAETFLADGTRVSTVFLGVDHNHARLWSRRSSLRPILFETMAFPVAHRREDVGEEIDQVRYCTRDDAIRGHCEMVARWEAVIARTQKLLTAIVDDLAQPEQRSQQPAREHEPADLGGLGGGHEAVEQKPDGGDDDGGADGKVHDPRVFLERTRI
jgi:hypothetical protein